MPDIILVIMKISLLLSYITAPIRGHQLIPVQEPKAKDSQFNSSQKENIRAIGKGNTTNSFCQMLKVSNKKFSNKLVTKCSITIQNVKTTG